MNLGIQKKFALIFSGFLIIAFTGIMWGFLSYSIRLTRENIAKHQFAMTELIARSIDDKLGTYLSTIAQLSQKVNADHFANPEKAQTFLDEHRGLISIFDNGIALVNGGHTLIAETPYIEGRRGTKANQLVPFLDSVQKNDFPDISNPYLSPKTNAPSIAVVAPVSGRNGQVIGFLIGSINLTKDYFVEELMGYKIGKTGYLYLFNADRTMIIHPDKNRIMKQDVPLGVNKYFDMAVRGFEGSGETINSRGVPQLASYKQLRTVNWILASAFPLEEAYAPVRDVRNSLFAATALVTFSSIVLVWILTSKIIAGLNSFTGQVREIMEHPDGKHEIHIDSNDEVTLLATTFNKLMNELDLTREELEKLTRTDHLTGLFNRRHLGFEAPKLIGLSERKNTPTAVALVDIDNFKKINDNHGHEAGDAVLVRLAKTLQSTVRPYDLVVRYGGEEFLVLLPMSTSQESMEIAERIRCTIQDTPIKINNEQLSITVSIGLYVSEQIHDLQGAIMRADEALYYAKNNGRNQVCLAPV